MDPVPDIDRADGQRQPGPIILGECVGHRLPVGIGGAGLFKTRQRLGPGQGGAFARRVKRAFPPSDQHVQTQRHLAILQRFGGVHLHAVGAGVDLAGAQLDQMQQAVFLRAGLDRGTLAQKPPEPGSMQAWRLCSTSTARGSGKPFSLIKTAPTSSGFPTIPKQTELSNRQSR